MRDIRHDLRERLAFVNGRFIDQMAAYDEKRAVLEQEHRVVIKELESQRDALKELLAFEEARDGKLPDEPLPRKLALRLPLADFIVTKLHTHGPLDKDELRQEANLAGYFEEATGRTFHLTLMNIVNGGRVARCPDGRYSFPQRGPNTLFGMGQSATKEQAESVM